MNVGTQLSIAIHYSILSVFTLQTRPSAQVLHSSLLFQSYPGTNAMALFPNAANSHQQHSAKNSSSGCNNIGNSELERVLEENRRLKQQLGLL